MSQVGYYIARLKGKLRKKRKYIILNKYFQKQGVNFVGNALTTSRINSNIALKEPYLIFIGDNITIAANVSLVTHDNSICKVLPQYSDLFGKVVIGNNCFIGEGAIIMPGVTIASNVIVGAGSVVTKSITEENVVIGGNPARVISTWEQYRKKYKNFGWDLKLYTSSEIKQIQKQGYKLIEK